MTKTPANDQPAVPDMPTEMPTTVSPEDVSLWIVPDPVPDDRELREQVADIFDNLCEPTNQFWHRSSGLYYADQVLKLVAARDAQKLERVLARLPEKHHWKSESQELSNGKSGVIDATPEHLKAYNYAITEVEQIIREEMS